MTTPRELPMGKFIGQRIMRLRVAISDEIVELGWEHTCYPVVVVEIEGGLKLVASSDDEGNDPGVMFLLDAHNRQSVLMV